jgi:tetratricopeptide (TPR) repeat protein
MVGPFQDESDPVPEDELAEPVHEDDDDEWEDEDDEDEDDEDDDESGIPDPVTEDDVFSVVDAFPDLERGCSAHRAIGVVLAQLGHSEAAKKALDKSLEQSQCDDERFVTLVTLGLLSTSCLDLQEIDAQQYITQALALPNRPNTTDDGRQLIQLALVSRAEWEANHQMYAQAYEKTEEAMTVWPGNSSVCFAYLICWLGYLDEHNKILQKVEQWNPMRLAFTGDVSLTVNQYFQRAAKLSGNEVVITKTYELLIKHLEPLNMASGTQYHFALACRRILRDVEKAKALLYQILDSEVCIDPVTDTVSDSIPFLALNELAEIIFEQFCAASTVEGKMKLLQEMEGLPKRRLGNVNADDSQCNPYFILARMYRKVGPVTKFYETLHPVFLSCVSSLQDDNPWNDAATLRQLCNVLFCLRGLEDDAQLAYSAQFSVLSKDVIRKNKKLIRHLQRTPDGVMVVPAAADEDSDEDEAHGADGATEQDYDVADIAPVIRCGGVCQANTLVDSEITNWEAPLYRCVICANTDLCESCYQALGESPPPGDDGGMLRKYCGLRHEYVRGPAAGWKGIKDGKIIIDGRDQLLFTRWLQDLKDVKWPQAWERFCEGY